MSFKRVIVATALVAAAAEVRATLRAATVDGGNKSDKGVARQAGPVPHPQVRDSALQAARPRKEGRPACSRVRGA